MRYAEAGKGTSLDSVGLRRNGLRQGLLEDAGDDREVDARIYGDERAFVPVLRDGADKEGRGVVFLRAAAGALGALAGIRKNIVTDW